MGPARVDRSLNATVPANQLLNTVTEVMLLRARVAAWGLRCCDGCGGSVTDWWGQTDPWLASGYAPWVGSPARLGCLALRRATAPDFAWSATTDSQRPSRGEAVRARCDAPVGGAVLLSSARRHGHVHLVIGCRPATG